MTIFKKRIKTNLKNKLIVLWILVFCGIFFLKSCSNKSIFFGFDTPDTEEISKLTGESLLNELEKNIGSKIFYDNLTSTQKQRILINLDSIIKINYPNAVISAKADLITKASLFAIDILIYTDSLTYAVIYNLVDPAIVVISNKNVTLNTIFASYTEPLQQTVQKYKSNAQTVISNCLYNMYKITQYYDMAASIALDGSYSGGDLQKYLVSGLVSGIVTGTTNAINASSQNIDEITNIIANVYIQAETENITNILTYLFNELPISLNSVGVNIGEAYKQELHKSATILGIIARNAGYENLANLAISVLERWSQ